MDGILQPVGALLLGEGGRKVLKPFLKVEGMGNEEERMIRSKK